MKIAFTASKSDAAQTALKTLVKVLTPVLPAQADVIVALGGDGFMLRTLQANIGTGKQIYGMNCGTVGFLMNTFHPDDLLERIGRAETHQFYPLHMQATTQDGDLHESFAFNEVALFRQTHQAAKIAIYVDAVERLSELVCDGVMLATPAGSSAYNHSAYGPILPLGAGALALTPISPFRPRRWRGAVLPREATVTFKIQSPLERPVSSTADTTEIRDVSQVTIREDRTRAVALLFDPEHGLDERITREQFTT